MSNRDDKTKLKIAEAVKAAFGFSEAEARVFAGLENELLQEASINQLTVAQVLDQTKNMSGDELKAALDAVRAVPEIQDETCGDIFNQDLVKLEAKAKEAEPKPTLDSFLAKLRN